MATRTLTTFQLIDDGTVDTVIKCQHGELVEVLRYAPDVAYDYRNDSGTLDLLGFLSEVVDPEFENILEEEWYDSKAHQQYLEQIEGD